MKCALFLQLALGLALVIKKVQVCWQLEATQQLRDMNEMGNLQEGLHKIEPLIYELLNIWPSPQIPLWNMIDNEYKTEI